MTTLPVDDSVTYFGVIGADVSGSLSPAVHNAAFAALGLAARFVAVSTDDPAAVIGHARENRWGGLAVTMPFKQTVVNMVDEVREADRRLGALNTLVFAEGKTTGANTDVDGILGAFAEAHVDLAGRRIVIIGAGGVAIAAVAAAISGHASRLVIVNRTRERAQRIRNTLDWAAISPLGLDEPAAHDELGRADIVIQTTPVGGPGSPEATPIDPRGLRADVTLLDVIYRPLPTALMRAVAERGGKVIGGDRMFLHQAAAQCVLWTQHEAPFAAMERAFYEAQRS